MIIGQVNRQVAYGGLFKNLFKKRKDIEIYKTVSDLTNAQNALDWATEIKNPKKIAEATKRVKKATQAVTNAKRLKN